MCQLGFHLRRAAADPTIDDCGRVVANPEVGSSGANCCSVSDNWRLVGAVRKIEFKLSQFYECDASPGCGLADFCDVLFKAI